MTAGAVAMLLLVGVARVSAIPENDELRLSLHGRISNAYLIDSDRLRQIGDVFTITVAELGQVGTTSAAHLTALGAFAHVQYGLHEHIAAGFYAGFSTAFAGTSSPGNFFRAPFMATISFAPLDWLEIQPEIGLNLSYNSYNEEVSPNLDTGIRLRFLDRIDLHGGFLYGAVVGFHFSLSVRLFDIFAGPLSESLSELPPEPISEPATATGRDTADQLESATVTEGETAAQSKPAIITERETAP